ncbi:YgfZ/GcvT domain-containing protein [Jiella sonneratiae]|uniref:Folate-binding protein YgfZ n=1 Tax=Jiella sonneratiae TaxID=2816856 RepID=A0ABS3J3U3_9HYPH|nr:folate-binding protein YgfZ [Jiella sonneratiae]MBO0904334.1 folate-binding protein YgfZ [Jiella sonneratiae]
MPIAALCDRATLHLTGPETEEFLQGIVTADLAAVGPDAAAPAALLTPQGKILFEFLISRIEGGVRLDGPAGLRAELKKRLALYRLRRKIAIEESDEAVLALWDGAKAADGLVDRRFPGGDVQRAYGAVPPGPEAVPAEAFRVLRIGRGVAELGADYPQSEMFPHDVLMDFTGGVSFKKGCFVGQEVVSRMQHRGTARRRLMLVRAETPLAGAAEIMAADKPVGTLLAVEDAAGLAMVRLDRLAKAAARGAAVTVEGVPAALAIPSYAGYRIPAAGEDEAGDAA